MKFFIILIYVFYIQAERNYIMEVVCEATQSTDTKVKVAALQCLVKIMTLYYQFMEPYMGQALFPITLEAMKSDINEVALQGNKRYLCFMLFMRKLIVYFVIIFPMINLELTLLGIYLWKLCGDYLNFLELRIFFFIIDVTFTLVLIIFKSKFRHIFNLQ